MFASSATLSFRTTGITGDGSEGIARRHGVRTAEDRRGLTLIEVLLATAILVVSLAALAQQNATGTRAALRSRLETESAIRCQSQLNRLLTQNGGPQSQHDVPFDDDNRWRWSAHISSSEFPDLSLLTVEVVQTGSNQGVSRFSLDRLFRNSASSASMPHPAGVRR